MVRIELLRSTSQRALPPWLPIVTIVLMVAHVVASW